MTVAHQAPPSMGFSRKEYCSGLPFPSPIPKKKKCKKAKWWSEEALQIAEKKREVKGKGGNKRYTHLIAEFQRIARRDKKVFLSDQCKEMEENNRMGKARGLFNKIRDTKGVLHAQSKESYRLRTCTFGT